jgi:hypothetical protein
VAKGMDKKEHGIFSCVDYDFPLKSDNVCIGKCPLIFGEIGSQSMSLGKRGRR